LVEQPEIAAAYPGLIDAASIIGGTAIQGRATLGGNLCNAAPSGDAISAMLMLGATCLIAGPAGRRVMPAEAFCRGPGQTELGRGELLVSIHFPPPQRYTGARYLRFTPRREMDIAVAGAGAWLALSDDLTTIMAARIALAAVAPTPLLAWSAGESLRGKAPTEAAFAAAAALAQAEAKPITDVRGSAAQRRHLVGVLVKRALAGAVRRAKGERLDD
jgi:carbon-monoxide dehydrogenase medium subunit